MISYIDKTGQIAFTSWNLPSSEMFRWKFTTKSREDKPFPVYDPYTNQPVRNPDGSQKYAQWKCFNGKPICKQRTKFLPPTRVNECINYWGKQLQSIHDFYMPETWFCDIETDVTMDGFPDAESARNAINTIAITKFPETIVFGRKPLTDKEIAYIQKQLDTYSEHTKGYKFTYKYFEKESEMLDAFIDFIVPIPAVTGWNFLGYDWPYICNRAKILGLDIDRVSPTRGWDRFKLNRKNVIDVKIPRHKLIYDYMIVYQQWDRTVEVKENSTLDFVSGAVIGAKKVKHKWGFEEFYKNHYADYVFYNSVDTILVEKIDKKIATAKIWLALTSELKVDAYAAYSTVQPTEIVMSNFLYDKYMVVCSPEEHPHKKEYEGAFVWPTQPGIYKYICGLDFASLYPSIMRQFNISPETFIVQDQNYEAGPDEIKTVSGAVFKKEKGLVPAILDVYFAKRKQAKVNKKIAEHELEQLKEIYLKRFGKEYIHFD